MFKNLLVLVTLSLAFPSGIKAQIVINEVLPNPQGGDDGAEWVELYNTSSQTVPLLGCVLHLHETDNNQNVLFGEEDFVEKYKVISWDRSWLNNNADEVRLECGTYSDTVSYGSGKSVIAPSEGNSLGRSPDGEGGFYVLSSVTLGEVNSAPPTSTPLPTNTATVTPRLTPTPKPSNTPIPTNMPTQIKAPTGRAVEDQSIEDELKTDENGNGTRGVLSANENTNNKENSDQVEEKKENVKNFPIVAVVFILVGFGLIVFPVFSFLRMKKL